MRLVRALHVKIHALNISLSARRGGALKNRQSAVEHKKTEQAKLFNSLGASFLGTGQSLVAMGFVKGDNFAKRWHDFAVPYKLIVNEARRPAALFRVTVEGAPDNTGSAVRTDGGV